MKQAPGGKGHIVCQNKKAHHDYFIEEIYECGISLTGTEIKSLRLGKCSINDSYCEVKDGNMQIVNMHISKYEQGNIFNHDPDRKKILLLHRHEIVKLATATQRDGYTLVPLNVHIVKGLAKVDIGLAKGKKLYDKKESLKEKDIQRDIEKNF